MVECSLKDYIYSIILYIELVGAFLYGISIWGTFKRQISFAYIALLTLCIVASSFDLADCFTLNTVNSRLPIFFGVIIILHGSIVLYRFSLFSEVSVIKTSHIITLGVLLWTSGITSLVSQILKLDVLYLISGGIMLIILLTDEVIVGYLTLTMVRKSRMQCLGSNSQEARKKILKYCKVATWSYAIIFLGFLTCFTIIAITYRDGERIGQRRHSNVPLISIVAVIIGLASAVSNKQIIDIIRVKKDTGINTIETMNMGIDSSFGMTNGLKTSDGSSAPLV